MDGFSYARMEVDAPVCTRCLGDGAIPRGQAQALRRRSRLISYAQALAEQPGKMIPELFTRKYDIQATYDLLGRGEATPDAIQAGHRRLVKDELRKPGRFLLIEDTTFPSFTHRKQAVPGLGPIGGSEEGQQGFLLHSVLAVRAPLPARPDASGHRPPVTILGLIDQQYLIRSPRPEAKAKQTVSRQRTERDRESDRWLESSRRIGPAPTIPRSAGSVSPIARQISMNICVNVEIEIMVSWSVLIRTE